MSRLHPTTTRESLSAKLMRTLVDMRVSIEIRRHADEDAYDILAVQILPSGQRNKVVVSLSGHQLASFGKDSVRELSNRVQNALLGRTVVRRP